MKNETKHEKYKQKQNQIKNKIKCFCFKIIGLFVVRHKKTNTWLNKEK